MKKWWVVRAGRNAVYLDDFISKGMVTIGGERTGDLNQYPDKKALLKRISELNPDWKPGKLGMWGSQCYKFANALKSGDQVLTYDPQARVYHIGALTGSYGFKSGILGDHPNYWPVEWIGKVSRDDLSTSTKNSLGAISTLFQIPEDAAIEIEKVLHGKTTKLSPEEDDRDIPESDLLEDIEARALEFIKDQVTKLDWDEMQELVAGILRAMGYKTRVSPSGADRGKDIIASPDGFGFENPRIVVEVKHRCSSSMGSQEIRSFLGGRHQNDKGLYVSTGGFTKDAYYEAERANIPLTLMNLDDLVRTLLEHYDNLDLETKQLVPLKKLYWPL